MSQEIDDLRAELLRQMAHVEQRFEDGFELHRALDNEKFQAIASLLSERDRRYEARAQSQQLALNKADDTAREYRKIANEWRGALSDLSGTMLTRREYEVNHVALQNQLVATQTAVGAFREEYIAFARSDEGRRSAGSTIREQHNWSTTLTASTVIGVLTVIVTVVAILLLKTVP